MRRRTTYHLDSRGRFADDSNLDAVMTISASASISPRQTSWLLRRAADEIGVQTAAAERRHGRDDQSD